MTSDSTFRATVKTSCYLAQLQAPGPDVIVLDEAHNMLKNSNNEVFKALKGVETSRKICLTGSPFQNNLLEYFYMIEYVRPGLLGSEKDFQKKFVYAIERGMASDAPAQAKELADEKLNQIQEILEPYVHRRDASLLLKDLPPLQHIVLHLRQTKMQSRLYGAFRKHLKNGYADSNFLNVYSKLRPVHNHPGCLLMPSHQSSKPSQLSTIVRPCDTERPETASTSDDQVKKTENDQVRIKQESSPSNVASNEQRNRDPENYDVIELLDSDVDDDGDVDDEGAWWAKVAQKHGLERLKAVVNGNKVVVLLHILVHASILDEKVVLFSQCLKVRVPWCLYRCRPSFTDLNLVTLKTLDFLEEVLSLADWMRHVPSLSSSFPGHACGGWKLGREYLRMDGQNSGAERGGMITQFNQDLSGVKLFLISAKAGGIGINLCSANRVSRRKKVCRLVESRI